MSRPVLGGEQVGDSPRPDLDSRVGHRGADGGCEAFDRQGALWHRIRAEPEIAQPPSSEGLIAQAGYGDSGDPGA